MGGANVNLLMTLINDVTNQAIMQIDAAAASFLAAVSAAEAVKISTIQQINAQADLLVNAEEAAQTAAILIAPLAAPVILAASTAFELAVQASQNTQINAQLAAAQQQEDAALAVYIDTVNAILAAYIATIIALINALDP